jgi:hypothetical protein
MVGDGLIVTKLCTISARFFEHFPRFGALRGWQSSAAFSLED